MLAKSKKGMGFLILWSILVFLHGGLVHAQIGWTEYPIAEGTFAGASDVYAIDLDGDEDMDVLGAAYTADEITWWENDGNENFTKHTIDSLFDDAVSVYALDIDGDDDVDVLGAAMTADDITWWENDGSENFTKHTIVNNFDGATSVYAIDIEPDGDIDVLGAAMNADEITWWENDGNENFTKDTIADSFDFAWSVYALDIDNDNDVDVLGAAMIAGDITWWENDGSENFTKHTIDSLFNGAMDVYALDIDGDGAVDVLGAAMTADDITWWRSDLLDMWDVGPVSIDIPATVPEDTTLYPQATVTNFGTNTETFLVTCEIDPGDYTRNRTVNDLAPGDTIPVEFLQPFTFEPGTYTVTVYTRLTDDDDPANDTLVKVIETYVPGVTDGYEDTPEVFSFSAPTINKGKTNVKLALPVGTKVDLLVYDAIGRLSETLVSERFSAGNHKLNVNLNLPAGVYFYNLKTGSGENVIKKFIVLE